MSVAPQHSTAVSIDDDMDLLTEQIQALTALGQRDEVSDGEIYDVSIRWGAALAGRLPRLVHYSRLGLLDQTAERRYAALCDELRGMSELIDRFGVARPVFTDPPPATAKRHRGPGRTTRQRGHANR